MNTVILGTHMREDWNGIVVVKGWAPEVVRHLIQVCNEPTNARSAGRSPGRWACFSTNHVATVFRVELRTEPELERR